MKTKQSRKVHHNNNANSPRPQGYGAASALRYETQAHDRVLRSQRCGGGRRVIRKKIEGV